MSALTSLSSKINNTIHPRCNLSFSNYCLDKWVHLRLRNRRSLADTKSISDRQDKSLNFIIVKMMN